MLQVSQYSKFPINVLIMSEKWFFKLAFKNLSWCIRIFNFCQSLIIRNYSSRTYSNFTFKQKKKNLRTKYKFFLFKLRISVNFIFFWHNHLLMNWIMNKGTIKNIGNTFDKSNLVLVPTMSDLQDYTVYTFIF